MPRITLLLCLLCFALPAQASAVKSALSGAELRGAATFRFAGFPLYQARLYTQRGAPLDWAADFGLELTYMRDLTEYDLVEGTLREIARTAGSQPPRGQLSRCFRDVRRGDTYLAVSAGPDQLRFWHNGEQVCTLRHPGIRTGFMAIFLGDNTRSKSFTRDLRGE